MISVLLAIATLVRVSDFGWNGTNDTAAVRAAFSSGAKTVVFDRQRGPWRTDTVRVGSDVELVFEEGVEVVAVKGAFRDTWASLFDVIDATNVVFRGEGKGAELRMLKEDYVKPPYLPSEHRHGINLLSTARVTIENLRIVGSGGDGIYLGESCATGVAKEGVRGVNGPCVDTVIRNCTCDRHHRQGISVISAENLLIEDCVLSNTAGTMPQSGIDFEPNFEQNRLVNCVMRNCLSVNNAGCGYEFYLGNLDKTSVPTDIRIENCRSVGSRNAILYSVRRPGDMPKGEVRFSDCSFEDTRGAAVRMFAKGGDAIRLVLDRCSIRNDCTEFDAADVLYRSDSWCERPPDGISFLGLDIRQAKAHPWFLWDENRCLSPATVTDIVGDVTVTGPDGKAVRHALDDAWRAKTFAPKSSAAILPHVLATNPPNGIEVRDSCPGKPAKLTPVIPHWRARYVFFVDRPGDVRFTMRQQVEGEKANPGTFTVRYGVQGKDIVKFAAPDGTVQSFSFTAAKRGFYTMRTTDPRVCAVMETCNVPVAVDMQDRLHELKLCDGNAADLWLDKPASGGYQLVVRAYSSNQRVAVTVTDAAGRLVGQDPSVWEWTSFAESADASPGLRKVRFAAPPQGLKMAFKVDLAGAPAALFLSPEKTWHLQERLDLYLLIGQSNMAGRGKLTKDNRVSSERVLKLENNGRWVEAREPLHLDKMSAGAGPGASFARAMADADPSVTVGLIPCAFGGTSLGEWMPGRYLYNQAVLRAREAMKRGELKGIL